MGEAVKAERVREREIKVKNTLRLVKKSDRYLSVRKWL